jgi:hypothetical protein
MLAIIGPNWLTAKDEAGQRRLSRSPSWLPQRLACFKLLRLDVRISNNHAKKENTR